MMETNEFVTTIVNFNRSNVREAIPSIGDFSRSSAKLVSFRDFGISRDYRI